MPSDMESMILEQLREMRAEMRADMFSIRADLRTAMIEVGALKAKVAAIAGIAGILAAGVMQVAGQVFFS
jgi:hypothetical protein